jgi:amidase
MRQNDKQLRRTLEKGRERLAALLGRGRAPAGGVGRRDFLRLAALAGAGTTLAGATAPRVAKADPGRSAGPSAPSDLNEATIARLQAAMASGHLTSVELTEFYLKRILALDQNGPGLNAVIELNPDALGIARGADLLRRRGQVLSPLHGIPVLLKDNIDTGDRMQTTAGSFALAGAPAARDSTAAARLRAGGAVILGKANLSEWANFRSFFSSSGWSGRGGQTGNPYAVDRNPSGSSSGSAAAASANLTAVSLGTETDGSIVSPANACGVAAIKPTVGLTSRAGVVPISHTQDTVGPLARTVADAAAVLSVIASRAFDGRDPATGGVPLGLRGVASRPAIDTDYTRFLDPDGLRGARIGVSRQAIDGASPATAAVFDEALRALQSGGASLVEVTFPHQDDLAASAAEITVLCFDFKQDLAAYFASRRGVPMAGKALQDLIDFDNAHADVEMPFFAQELLDLTALFSGDPTDPNQPFGMSYGDALDADQLFGATEGIDLVLRQSGAEAIVMPTGAPAWTTDLVNADHFVFGSSGIAAIVGYPIVNVPMGAAFGLPLGLSFVGPAFGEGTLIRLASGFEHVAQARIVPGLPATLPLDHVKGVPLARSRRGEERHRLRPKCL